MIVDIQIPKLPLKDGQYSLTLFTTVGGEISDWVQNAAVMDVEAGDFYGTGKLLPEGQGSFYMDYNYRLRSQS
jgi:lipopolysaccharide transport system ATP-binding protein